MVGICSLVDVMGPLRRGDLDATRDLHRSTATWFDTHIDNGRLVYAWVIGDVRALQSHISVAQPRGARVWVRLTNACLQRTASW